MMIDDLKLNGVPLKLERGATYAVHLALDLSHVDLVGLTAHLEAWGKPRGIEFLILCKGAELAKR